MKPRAHAGFTIMELLIAMTVSLMVSLAGWSFYRNQLTVLGNQAAGLDAAESARAAMAFMTREIRRAGYDPMDSAFTVAGSMGLSDGRTDRILIQWDDDMSGAIDPGAADPNPEIVLYAYDAANERILRTVNGSAQPLVTNVPAGGLLFEYFDANGNALTPSGTPAVLSAAQRDQVTFVRLRLRVNAETRGPAQVVELAARAALRNRILDRL